MSRVRMSWDWVGEYPIFIYTTFLDHFVFNVKLVKGRKGDQNAPGYGPGAPAWKEYVRRGLASKNEVVKEALFKAEQWIREEDLE